MSHTANGCRVVTISLIFFVVANLIWLGMPFGMAILWSLVDPAHPWSYPDIFPPVLSFSRWLLVWEKTSLSEALFNSYTIAPAVAVASLLLSLPTAYAFGRMTFRGKAVAEMLTLIPLVMPGMLIGIFFSAMLINLNIDNAFISIVIGHTVLTLPYSIRIMSAGFKSVPQDLIDASRDLGSGAWDTFCNAYLPLLKPSFLAALIFCLVRSLRRVGHLLQCLSAAAETELPGGADFLSGAKPGRVQHLIRAGRAGLYHRSDHSLLFPWLLLRPPGCGGGVDDSGDPQCHPDGHH
ncbi:TPA: ABC transporter permease [Escherichia coli]